MLKIVFLDESSLNDSDLTPISRLGDYKGYASTQPGEIVTRAADADVVIVNKTPIGAETMAALPKLKLICVTATGMNNIDLRAAEEAGVEVRNAVDYSTNSVAEQTFCGVLALLKQTVYYDDYVKSGQYSSGGRLFDFSRPTHELHGKKWGIVGMGNIGRRVAQIAEAFGCEVSYYSTSGENRVAEYPAKPLDELMMQSDIVSVHAPLNDATRNLIDYHQLSLMHPTSIIANMARGGIINEEGLVMALNDNLIAGVALDVYSHEPLPADSPLMHVRDKYRLLLSPHLAWATKEAIQTLVAKVADNIEKYVEEQARKEKKEKEKAE